MATIQADVSVIGTGAMGGALARTLAMAGVDLVVWNRTKDRAEALRGPSCRPVAGLAEAVRCSPVIVVCVLGYSTVRELLSSVEDELRGKIILQVSTGTPAEASDLYAWLRDRGCGHVEAAIMAGPRHVGTDDCTINYAGAAEDFAALEKIIKAWGGTASYLGTDVALPNGHDNAAVAFFYGVVEGFLEGASIASAAGVDLDGYLQVVRGLIPLFDNELSRCTDMIKAGKYADDQATMACHRSALHTVATAVAQSGVPDSFLATIRDRIDRHIEEGADGDHIAVLFEQFRRGRRLRQGGNLGEE